MSLKTKLAASAVGLTAAATLGLAPTAGAVTLPVNANNLVGVQVVGNQVVVSDLVDANVQAAIPVGVAANICNVNVGVLAEIIAAGGTCDADAEGGTVRQQAGIAQAQRFGLNL